MPFVVLALLLVPILEIYFIVQVGQAIGAGPTVLLLIGSSILGAWLVRREGRRAWQALVSATGSGRLPTKELVDGGLVLIGGTLLLTPGFATDAVGFLLLAPFTRPVARAALIRFLSRRMRMVPGFPPGGPRSPTTPRAGRDPRVVDGEVVDDDPDVGS